ncbi:hypothetical protein ACXHQ0_04945 [Vibrio antiquarius]
MVSITKALQLTMVAFATNTGKKEPGQSDSCKAKTHCILGKEIAKAGHIRIKGLTTLFSPAVLRAEYSLSKALGH